MVSLEGVLVEERRQGKERREEARMTLKMTAERAFKEKESMMIHADKLQEEIVQYSKVKGVLEEKNMRLEATNVEMGGERDRLVLLIEGGGGGGGGSSSRGIGGMRHQAARVGPLERRVKEMEEESKQLTKEIHELDAAGVHAREETTTTRGKLEDVLERLERMSLESEREMTELRATHQRNDTAHRLQMTDALRHQREAEEKNMNKNRDEHRTTLKATTDDYERRLSKLEMDLKEEAHTQSEHYQRERSNLVKRHESAVRDFSLFCPIVFLLLTDL